MAEEITGPLGMPDTAFLPNPDTRRDDGGLDLLFESGRPPGLDGGLRPVRMINAGARGPLLAPATVARMSVNQIGDLRVRRLPTTNARISADAEFMRERAGG